MIVIVVLSVILILYLIGRYQYIKKHKVSLLRKKIKYWYCYETRGLFGVTNIPKCIIEDNIIIYGENPIDAIKRARKSRRLSDIPIFSEIETSSCEYANYALIPVETKSKRFIIYFE